MLYPVEEVNYSSVDSAMPGQEELLRDLEQFKRRIKVVTVKRPEQVRLNYDGCTVQGRRFTLEALRRCSRLMSPGMSSVMGDVLESSAEYKSKDVRGSYSDETAIELFNSLLDLRFDTRLRDKKLVIDAENHAILGVLNKTFMAFSTLDAYINMLSFALADTTGSGARFHEAQTVGDRIYARVRLLPEALIAGTDGMTERFYYGFHVVNSYSAAPCFRVTPVIIRANDNSQFAVVPPEGVKLGQARRRSQGAVNSRKGDPVDKIHSLMESAYASLPEPEQLLSQVSLAKRAALGLGDNAVTHTERLDTIIASVKRKAYGLPDWFFDRVRKRLLTHNQFGRDTGVAECGGLLKWESRSVFDLCIAISQVGRQLEQYDTRTKADELAYSVLFSKFSS